MTMLRHQAALDNQGPTEEVAEEQERELARLLMSRYPGKNAYEIITQAYQDQYPEGKLRAFREAPAREEAMAGTRPDPNRPGEFEIAGYGLHDLDLERQVGVLGHEALGHGGDIAKYPESFPRSKDSNVYRHFLRGGYGELNDDIGWLINDVKTKFDRQDKMKAAIQRVKDEEYGN